MSTWTFKTVVAAAVFALSACDGTLPMSRNATEAVRLPSGVVVEGSRGWCVARDMLRTDEAASVVVFGSCAAITKEAAPDPSDVPGVITVSVDNTASGTAPADVLDAYFATERGRAALARDGRAESVRILETRQSGDALFLHAIDRSGVPFNAAEDYWRSWSRCGPQRANANVL